MIKIHNPPQRSEAWRKLREPLITGSNAYTLLRHGKVAAIAKNSQKSFSNYWSDRGIRLESEALKVYSAMNDDVDIQEVGFVTNDKYPNAGASPDGVVGDVLLEVKCFKLEKHLYITARTVPVEIMSQIQFNMLICELSIADLVLYHPDADRPYKVIRVKAGKTIHANIINKLGGLE